MRSRELDWHACRNARDLGGLQLRDGEAPFGAVVRTETLRQLSRDGWRALHAYGVTTIVDLREPAEIEADEPLDAGPGGIVGWHHGTPDGRERASIRTVNVPLLEWSPELGEHFDRISLGQPDAVAATRAVYLEMLRLARPRFVQALLAIGEAPDGAVLVHCHAGKDRTGLVVALLLELAGASPETIAADYALSGRNLASLMQSWLESAVDERDRELRRRVGAAPEAAMSDVVGELEALYGGAEGYLRGAGATDDDLARMRARLAGP